MHRFPLEQQLLHARKNLRNIPGEPMQGEGATRQGSVGFKGLMFSGFLEILFVLYSMLVFVIVYLRHILRHISLILIIFATFQLDTLVRSVSVYCIKFDLVNIYAILDMFRFSKFEVYLARFITELTDANARCFYLIIYFLLFLKKINLISYFN